MSFPQILEVAIGLVLAYYVMGSVVSGTTQYALDTFQVRKKIFQEHMKIIFGSEYLNKFLELPQIKTLGTRVNVHVLVDTFFDMTGLTAKRDLSLLKLARLVEAMPTDSAGRNAMIAWINQGISNVEDIRIRATNYFAGLIEEIEDNYSTKSRKYMLAFSLAITLITGIDSFQLAKELWVNSGLRTVEIQSANVVTDNNNSEFTIIPIKIGWAGIDFPSDSSSASWFIFLLYKFIGLGITVICVSQGSAFWFGLIKKLG